MIFPKIPFKNVYTTAGNKVKYIRNIDLIDAIQQLEMHLMTAICAKSSDDFISGIERSISILKELNLPMELDDEGDAE